MQSVQDLSTWLRSLGLSETGSNLFQAQNLSEKILNNVAQFKKLYNEKNHVVFIDCYPTHLLSISIHPTKLTSYLTMIGFKRSVSRLSHHINGIMASVGLEINEKSEQVIEGLNSRDLVLQPVIEEVLSEGVEVVPAKPSDVELLVKVFSKKPEYSESDSGQIDYHDLNLFQNIVQNQGVGRHIPAVPGIPGRDVFGETIPCGETADMPIQCGPGVLLNEQNGQYIATRAGYLKYEDRKLTIEDTYVIEGDVDLNVGHINFVSDVVVRGDILPDFSVHAGGSVEVIGTVTGATIESESDCHLRLGVLGQQGKSFLKIGGELKAKFLNECKIETEGKIDLQTEALNSILCCLEQIEGENAVIIGGRIVCLKEITVGCIGSELGLKTQVFLGEDYQNMNHTEEVREAILRLRERISILFSRHGNEIDFWQKDRCDTPEASRINKADIPFFIKSFEEIRSELSDLILLNQEFSLLSKEPNQNREPVCKIMKTLYPGTVFFFSGNILEIKEKVHGPVLVKGESTLKGKSSINLQRIS